MITMFAIPNCDTVKKARAFLADNDIAYEFIDFKKLPPTVEQIRTWSTFAGELPINKKGLTYRKNKDEYEQLSRTQQIEFIIKNTSLIKRPVLVRDGHVIALGFSKAQYNALF